MQSVRIHSLDNPSYNRGLNLEHPGRRQSCLSELGTEEPGTMPVKTNHSFFAILSDIHGKIDVLEAVFADIVKWPCKGVFRLSAAIGCGPESLLV